MPQQDTFDLIGKRVERTTPKGRREYGTIKATLPGWRVIVELENKQRIVINSRTDREWTLVEEV